MRALGALAALALLSTAAHPGAAQMTTSCSAFANFRATTFGDNISDSETLPGGCGASVNVEQASLTTEGEAGFGYLISRSEATLFAGPAPSEATAFTRVMWRDLITITSPGHTGENALMFATLFLDGVIDVTGVGRAGVSLVDGGVESEDCFLGGICFGVFDDYPRFVSNFYEAGFTVTIGAPTNFFVSLLTSASHSGSLSGGAGTASSLFGGGGEVFWGGIDRVEQGGQPIEYTITSQSGTDWTQPIPEPGAPLAGFAALATIAARRRS